MMGSQRSVICFYVYNVEMMMTIINDNSVDDKIY